MRRVRSQDYFNMRNICVRHNCKTDKELREAEKSLKEFEESIKDDMHKRKVGVEYLKSRGRSNGLISTDL